MNANRRPRSFIRRLLGFFLWLVAVALIALAALCIYAFRDRSPGYKVQLDIAAQRAVAEPRPLGVGFARARINPDLSDPAHPVWLAGFGQHRAATAIHDDLWAIGCVIDDGYTRIGIVALDAIGFFHDDVVAVRQRLPAQIKLDYAVVCSTHNHSTPDLLGLWGPDYLHSGVDAAYREQVISTAAGVLVEAAESLEPAKVAFYDLPLKPDGLVADTRRPQVFDPDLRLMYFTHQVDDSTIGSIVTWADHPETPWAHNTEITADFPGYLRDTLENGVAEDSKLIRAGLGGIHLYLNGAIGGLMTTSPSVTVRDPFTGDEFKAPCHEKARAVARQLASRILPVVRRADSSGRDSVGISVHARTLEIPVRNKLFLLAPVLGVVDRGHPGLSHWNKLRSEVALITIGDASIACIPGEIYPELVNGGVDRAPGGDFDIEPREVPPIRDLMPGKTKFVFGLANDEIGYIIPKSEWDWKAPYLYGEDKRPYGEINSVGPDAAEVIHAALGELCRAGEQP